MKISQSRTDQFVAYVSARRRFPRRTALLACGDWHLAENLVQTALVKLYRAWPRIRGEAAEDVYARRVIVRAFLDETRRPCTEHDVPGTDKTVRVADPDPETNLRFGVMYQRPDGSFTAVGVYDRSETTASNRSWAWTSRSSRPSRILTDPSLHVDPAEAAAAAEQLADGTFGIDPGQLPPDFSGT